MSILIARPELTFTEALEQGRGKLWDWKGRSRRSEFWWCALVIYASMFVLFLIPILGQIAQLFLGIAAIPLSVRRLHDTGHSGWWYAAFLVASIVLAGLMVVPLLIGVGGNPDQLAEKMVVVFTNPLLVMLLMLSWLSTAVLCFVLLVFFCQDSKAEANKWGESPKYVDADDGFDGKDDTYIAKLLNT